MPVHTTGSMLLLTRRAVAALATPADYLAAMRTAFVDLANRRSSVPGVCHVPCVGGDVHVKSAMRAGAPSLAAIKINANFPDNTRLGRPTIQGLIALLDADCGAVLALMDSIEITARRTAAATALAAESLARSGSRVLGCVGCGTQARYHIDALLDVAPIESVRLFDPLTAAADALASHAESLGITATRVAEACDVARGADIVVCTTTATRPVLRLADVGPGTFVAGVGADNPAKHELAPDLLGASRVVVDLLAQASAMGDLHHALRAGVMRTTDVHGDLGDLLTGRIAGRADTNERFVFDSTGVAIQDLAAAQMIHERARDRQAAAAIDPIDPLCIAGFNAA